MNRHKARKHQVRKSPSEIAALVDEGARLDSDIREGEQARRELRYKLKQAGRLDLARKFLQAPGPLRDLADLLWYNEAIVAFPDAHGRPLSAADFPEKRFRLIHSDVHVLTAVRSDGQPAMIKLPPIGRLIELSTALLRSKFAWRSKGVQRGRSAKELFMIEMAPSLFAFEEWACIFPDAALAGDYDFIERIVARFRDPRAWPLEDKDLLSIGLYWDSFKALGSADMIPPLKHWKDRAACEFVRFITRTRDHELTLAAYQKRKSRLRLHSKKPTLVTGARYICEGDTHSLKCWR
jgi:hypothetical protein